MSQAQSEGEYSYMILNVYNALFTITRVDRF